MSWPHILSFSRVVAGPIVAALVLAQPGDAYLVAALVFALACFTDLIDGKLARYSQKVSPLGVFLDTTSDKILVAAALVAAAIGGLTWAWIPLVILSREFLISGLRSYAASCNHIISAHIWGKGKAAITMVAITALLVAASGRTGGSLSRLGTRAFWDNAYVLSGWLLALAAVLTVVSGIRYVIDARPLFAMQSHSTEMPLAEPRRIPARRDQVR